MNIECPQDEVFIVMAEQTQALQEAGYRVIEKWECEDQKRHKVPHPSQQKPQ